ncbi:hypothetical protein Gotur_012431 [Gossypium turneri]
MCDWSWKWEYWDDWLEPSSR